MIASGHDLTSLIGRDEDLVGVRTVLHSARLVTIVGPGGVGKTRLAQRLAHELRTQFADGAVVRDVDAYVDRCALAADLQVLRGRAVLLVLDTCERRLADCAALVEDLLRRSPDMVVLATSQLPLSVAGERLWPLRPLRVPSDNAPWQATANSPAGQLFADRVRATDPAFAVNEHNAPSVQAICQQVDGLPLALELAAARLPLFGMTQVATLLRDGPDLLGGGHRTGPQRHQSLAASLDWSLNVLDPIDALIVQRLAVFVDGWTLAAAQSVCVDERVACDAVLPALQRLIDRSLVSFESQDGVSRYRMLRTLRQHLLGRPAAADEVDGARHRHLRWLTELAANSTADPFDGHRLALLVAEHANLDAALTWAFASDRAEEGVRLCTMCGPYWFQTGRYADAESWLIKLRAAVPSMTDAALLARAALLLGGLATIAGSDDSTAELRRAHRLARMAGDTRTYARAVHWLGEAYLLEGRHRRARLALEAAARHYTEEHDARVGGVYARLALACLGLNDLPAAEAHARSALAMAQTSGQAWALARAWHAIGVLSVARDDLDDALVALNRSHQHACLARTPSVRIDAALALASVYVSRREVSACGGVLLDLLHNVPFRALGAQVGKFERLVQQLLAVAPRGGRGTRAERLTRALSEQWSAARRNGVAPTGDAGGPAEVAPKPLSEREMEVARLIARDLTNRAIAAELTLSEGTVHVHVEHILRKLGLQSRAQVAHWVRQLVS